MDRLEEVFAKDKEQEILNSCREFETLKRTPEININEYTTEFERLYRKLSSENLNYPDSILAYKLLSNANISEKSSKSVGPQWEHYLWKI